MKKSTFSFLLIQIMSLNGYSQKLISVGGQFSARLARATVIAFAL